MLSVLCLDFNENLIHFLRIVSGLCKECTGRLMSPPSPLLSSLSVYLPLSVYLSPYPVLSLSLSLCLSACLSPCWPPSPSAKEIEVQTQDFTHARQVLFP